MIVMKKIMLTAAMSVLLFSLASAQSYRVNRTIEEKRKVKVKDEAYGKNILSFSPLQVVATSMNENPDLTVGASFERILDNQLVGVRLPVLASIQTGYVYFMPGIKLYPKKQGVVKYAIGPQFLIGMGNFTRTTDYYTSSGMYAPVVETGFRTQFGFFLHNSINFSLMKSLYASIDLGLGLKYFDSMPPMDYGYNDYFNPFFFGSGGNGSVSQAVQLGFSMGYRF
jgi:hypothetical protein